MKFQYEELPQLYLELPIPLDYAVDRIIKWGGVPYLVGGGVIDILYEREPKDWDVEVFNMSYETLIECLNFEGKPDLIGDKFGVVKLKVDNVDMEFSIPRKESRIGLKHRDFDITLVPDLSVEEAAKRRDFTVNAIYLKLPEGIIKDPYDGLSDLRVGKLHHVNVDTFKEDGLRAFRGIQIIGRKLRVSTYGLQNLVRDMMHSGDLNNVPGEAIFGEFDKLFMKADSFHAAALYMERSNLLEFFPELKALQDTPQNPKWHPEGWSFNFFSEKSPIPFNTSLAQTIRADGSLLSIAVNDLFSCSSTSSTMIPETCSTSTAESRKNIIINSLSTTRTTGSNNIFKSSMTSKTINTKTKSLMFSTGTTTPTTDKSLRVMFEIPFSYMHRVMDGTINDFQIIKRIIHSIGINMMNMLCSKKWSTEFEFHKDSMNTNSALVSWPTGINITRVIVDLTSATINNNILIYFDFSFKRDFDFSHMHNLLKDYNIEKHSYCKVKLGDCWEHTKLVMKQAFKYRDEVPEEWRQAFMWGMFLHDIGKPIAVDPETLSCHGHDKAGGKLARQFMERLKAPNKLTDMVVQIVEGHMRPRQLVQNKCKMGSWRKLQNVCPLNILAYVSMSDSDGRGFPPEGKEGEFKDIVNAWEKLGSPAGKIEQLLMGWHLIERGHIPGEEFGAILGAAYKYQIKTGETDIERLYKHGRGQCRRS